MARTLFISKAAMNSIEKTELDKQNQVLHLKLIAPQKVLADNKMLDKLTANQHQKIRQFIKDYQDQFPEK